MNALLPQLTAASLLVLATACHRTVESPTAQPGLPRAATAPLAPPDPCECVLAASAGPGAEDGEIRALRERIRSSARPEPLLERLGWMFVARARATFDPGDLRLAEMTARCLEQRAPGSLDALLLRGHVLHQWHRFAEAGEVAEELVRRRGAPFDHGLRGDVLLEVGRIEQAVESYQRMLDLRPDPAGLARAAQARWLTGDLPGARQLLEEATADAPLTAGGETAAWLRTRLAFLQWQSGDEGAALRSCDAVLAARRDFAPALLQRGRIDLARGRQDRAVEDLRAAARLNPLPEYQWVLLEALQECGRPDEAREVAARLERDGAVTDPRTYALYLATIGRAADDAVALARAELESRQDVFTHDALAWAMAAAGEAEAGWSAMQRALARNTPDPRLSFHATCIAAQRGDAREAQRWGQQAVQGRNRLLPSEQRRLEAVLARIGMPAGS